MGFLRIKKEDERGNGKLRYFILQGSTLHYYKAGHRDETLGSFELAYAVPTPAEGDMCDFFLSYRKRVYVLRGTSPEEVEEWVGAIRTHNRGELGAKLAGYLS
eukprot:CAMPEP_0119143918 /NCGR_PEP_ID=MMETSP1310-20130426/35074_1 /TAXON_ID=464262 /ORGANISM="Genus nov. species nov., Strain RCC2339" /LENGTH=102 /DNA_ID=CAMNT_0007135583 /DNA_START=27 /DNA_END=331 /DNA_ORIENTATION=+